MKKQDILKKYEIEEDRLLIAKLLDKLEMTNNKNYMTSTDFLNLYEQKITEDFLLKEIFFRELFDISTKIKITKFLFLWWKYWFRKKTAFSISR